MSSTVGEQEKSCAGHKLLPFTLSVSPSNRIIRLEQLRNLLPARGVNTLLDLKQHSDVDDVPKMVRICVVVPVIQKEAFQEAAVLRHLPAIFLERPAVRAPSPVSVQSQPLADAPKCRLLAAAYRGHRHARPLALLDKAVPPTEGVDHLPVFW